VLFDVGGAERDVSGSPLTRLATPTLLLILLTTTLPFSDLWYDGKVFSLVISAVRRNTCLNILLSLNVVLTVWMNETFFAHFFRFVTAGPRFSVTGVAISAQRWLKSGNDLQAPHR
jgi:archaellum biogenesis protein FlaJ (TadC family)